MAKSKIIKDLANGDVDTLTALKRAKVLLADFDNKEVKAWINNEITGYPADATLPDYRITSGTLFGSYYKGSMASHMTWNNVSIPLGKMPDDVQEALLSVSFPQGVDSLRQLSDNNSGQLGKVISADFFPYIASCNEDPFMMITSARVVIGHPFIHDILSSIENRLLDVLILLEKEFGSLDDMDLDFSQKTPDELNSISNQIIVIVYNDSRVTVGDGNRIKDSTIASAINESE